MTTPTNPTMNPNYDSISDVEITNEHIRFLSKAGASDAFIDLLTFPNEEVGVERHSVRQEVAKYVFWGDFEADPEDFHYYGGHFFEAMWRGDLFGAWLRADLNNKSLMLACFGKKRIIKAGVQSGQPRNYATRMVSEPAI